MGKDMTVVPADPHGTDSLQVHVLMPRAVSRRAELGTEYRRSQRPGYHQAASSCSAPVSGKLWFIHNGHILSSAQTLFDGWCNHHWQNSLLANYSPDTWKFFGKKKKETIQLFTALSKLWRLVQSNYCLCFSYFGSWELEVPLSSNWAMYLAHHHPPTLPILPFGMLITKQVAK